MIQKALLEQEYKRLGIRVSDDEIREAVRTSPPPFVLRDPQYQTDGQFDSRKWEQALANADPQSLAALEAEYRERIPESKLQEYLTADLYVSDGKLWRIYKDQRDSVRITSLPIWPSSIQDSSTFTDAQLSTYVSKHADEFKRPAVAFLRFVAQPRVPETADTAVARAQVEHEVAPLFEPRSVSHVWQDFHQGKTSWSRPWSLYVLQRWCELHDVNA